MADDAQHVVPRRKLIEVALPLEKINAAAAAKRPVKHPWSMAYWWARRPLPAARAVLFAQLVDDPSSDPAKFPTEAAQADERARLHRLIERLVNWERTDDPSILDEARAEILASTSGIAPTVVDPFAGGASIPLEAQRLGLPVEASDLNPVAVLINKAQIEVPGRFRGHAPVFPHGRIPRVTQWPGTTGMAEDVRFYGEWIHKEAIRRLENLYPTVQLPDGAHATAIAWIWARTVTCPNPGCGISMPLVRSWWTSRKRGREAYINARVKDGTVSFTVVQGADGGPTQDEDGTVGRTGARCISCNSAVALDYIRSEGRAQRIGARLMAIVAKGARSKIYLSPSPGQESAANVSRPKDIPSGVLPTYTRDFKTPNYGLTTIADLFTARQASALLTYCELIGTVRTDIESHAIAAGDPLGLPLETGGNGARAYADAIATYLSMALMRAVDNSSSITTWHNANEQIRSTFARQLIPMTWDYLEPNLTSKQLGSWSAHVKLVADGLSTLPARPGAVVRQTSAQSRPFTDMVISTDPPYYDNIEYADLSDVFYVWLRKSLREVYPQLFQTLQAPKAEELVANAHRHGGSANAEKFFEIGFSSVFEHARRDVAASFPATVYYAYKQTDSTSGQSSAGWQTLLDGVVRSGWTIARTWPMRSELGQRMLSQGTNALGSSVVFVLVPRANDAPMCDRRTFVSALKEEIPGELRIMLQGAISPTDLGQVAIGPGMSIFSRYSAVLEDNGTPMTVKSALDRINQVLDEVLWDQEGDFDSSTRFAIAWYRIHGFETSGFAQAEQLAQGRGASLDHLERSQILTKHAGKVTLLSPEAIGALYPDGNYDPSTDTLISTWEVVMHLARVLNEKGVPTAARMLSLVPKKIDRDLCKELAFLLFAISKQSKNAQLFNALGSAWNDIVTESRSTTTQLTIG